MMTEGRETADNFGMKVERHERLKKRRESKKVQEVPSVPNSDNADQVCHEYTEPSKVCAFFYNGRLDCEKTVEEKNEEQQEFLGKVKEECQRLICENSS